MKFCGTGFDFNGITTIINATLTTTSVTAGQVIATFPVATYRSAEILIQGVDATGTKYHRCNMNVVHNGTLANGSEYGSVDAGGQTGAFSVDLSGGNVRLLVTPTSANSTVFKATLILTAV